MVDPFYLVYETTQLFYIFLGNDKNPFYFWEKHSVFFNFRNNINKLCQMRYNSKKIENESEIK